MALVHGFRCLDRDLARCRLLVAGLVTGRRLPVTRDAASYTSVRAGGEPQRYPAEGIAGLAGRSSTRSTAIAATSSCEANPLPPTGQEIVTKTSRSNYRANSDHKRQTSYLSSHMAAISGQTPLKPRYVSTKDVHVGNGALARSAQSRYQLVAGPALRRPSSSAQRPIGRQMRATTWRTPWSTQCDITQPITRLGFSADPHHK